jgi:hypothetical protein
MKVGKTILRNLTKVHGIPQIFSWSKTFGFYEISCRIASFRTKISCFTQLSLSIIWCLYAAMGVLVWPQNEEWNWFLLKPFFSFISRIGIIQQFLTNVALGKLVRFDLRNNTGLVYTLTVYLGVYPTGQSTTLDLLAVIKKIVRLKHSSLIHPNINYTLWQYSTARVLVTDVLP